MSEIKLKTKIVKKKALIIEDDEEVISPINEFTNKIINGDSEKIIASMPTNSIDLTVTSPPYDDIRDYNGYNFNDIVLNNIIKELFRITKSGGVVVWVVGDSTTNGSESGNSFRQALKFIECGFKLHDTMIYEKNTSSFPARQN